MRRYWKLIGIIIVVVLTIGIFYTQSIVAKVAYPTFSIETKSGDEQLVTDLVIHGELKEKDGVVYSTITEDGTFYEGDFTYIDVLLGNHFPNKLKELQKEYRSFMRGKEDLASLTENDEVLAYVNIETTWSQELMVEDITFEVDVLQKDTMDQLSFDIPIRKEKGMDHMFVLNVEVLDEMIQVITQSSVYVDGSYDDYLYVYRLDMSTKELLSETVIEFPGIQLNYNADAHLVDTEYDNQTKYSLFVSEEYSEGELTDEGYQDEKMNREFILYNLETNTQEVIKVPEEIDLEFIPESFIDQTIYFTQQTEEVYQIIGYNIDNKQIEIDYTIDLNEGLDGKPTNVNVDEEYLYMYSPIKSESLEAVFTISDIKIGDMLYEGSIESDSNKRLYDDEHLYINHISRD